MTEHDQTTWARPSGRAADALRAVTFERDFTKHAAGSVLVSFGDTRVLCTVAVEDGVPGFLRGQGRGWLTAEYGMLPGSTHTRNDREAARGKQGGRTVEIQRLIGRSLRAMVDLDALGERTARVTERPWLTCARDSPSPPERFSCACSCSCSGSEP